METRFGRENERNELKALVAVYKNDILFHNVKDNRVLPAELLTEKNLKHIFKFVNNKKDDLVSAFKFKGFIPKNVLVVDTEYSGIIFYTEPTVQKMIFKHNAIKFSKGKFNMPWLLWKFKNGSINVYALKRKPEKMDDVLYQAPFFNVSSSGGLCKGNVNFKEVRYFEDFMKKIVKNFFDSVFTHSNRDWLLQGNYIEILEKWKDNDIFTVDDLLIETKQKISDIWL